MNITREDTPQREAVLQIELDPKDLEPHLERAYRRLSQRLKIPGFRPGKAPRVLVENLVGRDGLLEEALERVVADTIVKAMEEQKVEPFDLPRSEVVKRDPLTIRATVPLAPLVDLGDYKAIRVETKPVEVTDAQVDEVVEGIRVDSAPWEPVERPARFGDKLILDVTGWVDARRVADDRSVEYVLEKGTARPLPGFDTHLEGLSKGATKEFTLPVPQDHPDKSIAGKECRFSVKLLEVKERKVPALDDQFAKSVGDGFESLQALRDRVRVTLKEQAERAERRRVQEEAVAALLKQAKVVVSPLMVEREVARMMEEQERAMRERRLTMEQYLKDAGKTEETLREEMRKKAEERLTRSFVLGKVAEEEKLSVDDDEVSKDIEAMASATNDPTSVRNVLSADASRNRIGNALLARKVLDRLADYATGAAIKAAPVTAAPTAQPQEPPQEGATHGN